MFEKVLVANRGEVALRIVRAAQDLGIASVAIHADDDALLPHVLRADESVSLGGLGPASYLDGDRLIDIARSRGCDAVHPGYGFLSERADFAQACEDAGLRFIGPRPDQLALFGDKASARALALRNEVPLMPGTQNAVTLEQAQAFFDEQAGAGIMIKAIGGGGGRGMRAVLAREQLAAAYARCVSEARAAFGVEGVYVERMMLRARHIEIQVLGDGRDVVSLGERECSLQRRFQKLVEIAPSPTLADPLREAITQAALRMARAVGYRGLGTFEFLVDDASTSLPWVFIETNPRLQVEHTVTEEVTGMDLVQAQIRVAAGHTLGDLGLDPGRTVPSRGYAIQWRINAERQLEDGTVRPASGRLERLEWPSGPGVRLDTHALEGAGFSPHYDALLAKLVVTARGGSFGEAVRRSRRALAECRIHGLASNLSLLRAIAGTADFERMEVHTRYVEERLPALLEQAKRHEDVAPSTASHGTRCIPDMEDLPLPVGQQAIRAPISGRLAALTVAAGDWLAAATPVAVLEAMKMEHLVSVESACRVLEVRAIAGAFLTEGAVLIVVESADAPEGLLAEAPDEDLGTVRADLQAVLDRHAITLDASRPDAVTRRHAAGSRTARENIADLCDQDSFVEYGALAIAAQTTRRSVEDLIVSTPADGVVTGIATVNADAFGQTRSRCVVMAYDYTVLAGTQGLRGHLKAERLIDVAQRLSLPLVLFAEGGGGRPGDIDVRASLNNRMFQQYAALSGRVPIVGIAHGRCFAGNAALLGCSDVVIATRSSNIGMSGPAMIEGGGLGRFRPEDIGPSAVQARNGVIDLLVADEPAAVKAARQYLSYFQGPLTRWHSADQRALRSAVPENRARAYDVRRILDILVDEDSLLELRSGFAEGVVTALARIEGQAVGLMASNPRSLGGAIDMDVADKCARFMQLCDAHGLPLVSLVDTPGFMVGPDTEAHAQVRHACRMFVVAAHLSVPFFSVVLRKGYGLGAQAMTAGGFNAPVFTVAWPTGEVGPMGVEGAVRLGFRKELEAILDGPDREALFASLVARTYADGTALTAAQHMEIDAVIDPADTRTWLAQGLKAAGVRKSRDGGRYIDTW